MAADDKNIFCSAVSAEQKMSSSPAGLIDFVFSLSQGKDEKKKTFAPSAPLR